MALKYTLTLALALSLFGKAPWVNVVLKRSPFKASLTVGMQGVAGFSEVVIAAEGSVGLRFELQVKTINGRLLSHHCTTLHVRGWRVEWRERLLFIAENQHMFASRVPEVVMKTLFKTQPLNKVQVGLTVLHAVFARRIRRK